MIFLPPIERMLDCIKKQQDQIPQPGSDSFMLYGLTHEQLSQVRDFILSFEGIEIEEPKP